MHIGFGFEKGKNKVNKNKILDWVKKDNIAWAAFLWYISSYVELVEVTDDYFVVKLWSENQREFFYRRVLEYNEELGKYNFLVDKQDGKVWIDHKKLNCERAIYEKILAM